MTKKTENIKSKVFLKIDRMKKLDEVDNKGRIDSLCSTLKITKNYLLRIIKYGTYKPPLYRRKELSKALRLSMKVIDEHFKHAKNA